MDHPHVLLIDDEPAMCGAIGDALELAGIPVRGFLDAREALPFIERSFDGIILSDIRMAGLDGLRLASITREIDPEIPVILLSGHADVSMAVAALQDGAFDFISKPFAVDHLVAAVRRALSHRSLVLENRALRVAADLAIASDSPLLGETPAMVQLRSTVAQLAAAEVDVLIQGETGTGKELVALMLHRLCPRRARPFVAVNCGALTEGRVDVELFGETSQFSRNSTLDHAGLLQRADKGTLFLDEVDSMAPSAQIKLLRVLEEREILPIGADRPMSVDLRVVAASKVDLAERVRGGDFREDLFYRLNVVRLNVPPLRDRRADIPLLFSHFIEMAREKLGAEAYMMDDSTRRHLLEHHWPGNVRELKNFALSSVLGLQDGKRSDGGGRSAKPLSQRLFDFEGGVLREALEQAGGDIATALSLLEIPRKTLYHKLKRHQILPSQYRTRRERT